MKTKLQSAVIVVIALVSVVAIMTHCRADLDSKWAPKGSSPIENTYLIGTEVVWNDGTVYRCIDSKGRNDGGIWCERQ